MEKCYKDSMQSGDNSLKGQFHTTVTALYFIIVIDGLLQEKFHK